MNVRIIDPALRILAPRSIKPSRNERSKTDEEAIYRASEARSYAYSYAWDKRFVVKDLNPGRVKSVEPLTDVLNQVPLQPRPDNVTLNPTSKNRLPDNNEAYLDSSFRMQPTTES